MTFPRNLSGGNADLPLLDALQHGNQENGAILQYKDGIGWDVLKPTASSLLYWDSNGELQVLTPGTNDLIYFDASNVPQALSGSNGGLIYFNGSGVPTVLAAGSNGDYLTLSSGVPAWVTPTTYAQVATGTYTGNGSTSQSVTGVGFQPKVVFVTKRLTSNGDNFVQGAYVWTSNVIVDDVTGGAAVTYDPATENTFEIFTDTIIAIGSDGFTVDDGGSDNDPNANGVTYNYWAVG